MFKVMTKLAFISSISHAYINVNTQASRHAYLHSFPSFVQPRRCSAQITSLQFLHHGRRKQKHAYKRYLAKLRDESTNEQKRNIDNSTDKAFNKDYAQSNSSITRTRFRARVSYCGTPFYGWQLQPQKPTVQGEIEAVLSRRFHRRIAVVGAGRTDSGVHARGQAIHWDLFSNEIPFHPPKPPTIEGETNAMMSDEERIKCYSFCEELENSMNRMMPLDIRLFGLQLAPYTWVRSHSNNEDESEDSEKEESITNNSSAPQLYAKPWHVIQRAKSKWYSYRLSFGPTLLNPMERFTRTHFIHRPSFTNSANDEPYAITEEDIQRLHSILKLYEGTHDFGAFGGQLEQNAKKRNAGKPINTIRTVYKVELVKEPDYSVDHYNPARNQHGLIGEEGNYRIDFLLKGALYKMVRNMVGTAVEIWLGRMSEEQLIELLRIDDDEEGKMSRKDNPCKPAPPEGLCLECVYYDDGF